jgi:nucleotide sugar dehydrogenase
MVNKKKITVGVVGAGFVGRAVAHGFNKQNVILIDPLLGTHTSDLLDKEPDVVFICVPTPMGENGKIDASIVEKVLDELKELNTLLVLKSTVIPDIVDRLSKQYKNFIYNPEFLTERNAAWDFENPFMHVFGGNEVYCTQLQMIYEKYSICKKCVVKKMTAKEASHVKYSMNSFLALKVIFWNQMKEMMDRDGVSYNTVRDAFINDPRIGFSHSMVPGADGTPYTNSCCFNKDIPALIHYSDMSLSVLREAWNVNVEGRLKVGLTDREIEQHISYIKI